jgi:hypothetical protein
MLSVVAVWANAGVSSSVVIKRAKQNFPMSRVDASTKNVYWKALIGEIQRFTGMSDPCNAWDALA